MKTKFLLFQFSLSMVGVAVLEGALRLTAYQFVASPQSGSQTTSDSGYLVRQLRFAIRHCTAEMNYLIRV